MDSLSGWLSEMNAGDADSDDGGVHGVSIGKDVGKLIRAGNGEMLRRLSFVRWPKIAALAPSPPLASAKGPVQASPKKSQQIQRKDSKLSKKDAAVEPATPNNEPVLKAVEALQNLYPLSPTPAAGRFTPTGGFYVNAKFDKECEVWPSEPRHCRPQRMHPPNVLGNEIRTTSLTPNRSPGLSDEEQLCSSGNDDVFEDCDLEVRVSLAHLVPSYELSATLAKSGPGLRKWARQCCSALPEEGTKLVTEFRYLRLTNSGEVRPRYQPEEVDVRFRFDYGTASPAIRSLMRGIIKQATEKYRLYRTANDTLIFAADAASKRLVWIECQQRLLDNAPAKAADAAFFLTEVAERLPAPSVVLSCLEGERAAQTQSDVSAWNDQTTPAPAKTRVDKQDRKKENDRGRPYSAQSLDRAVHHRQWVFAQVRLPFFRRPVPAANETGSEAKDTTHDEYQAWRRKKRAIRRAREQSGERVVEDGDSDDTEGDAFYEGVGIDVHQKFCLPDGPSTWLPASAV